MRQIKRKILGFNAFFGLEEMAVTQSQFELALGARIRTCIDSEFSFLLPDRKTTKNYQLIQIADTFFSDSFPTRALKELFQETQKLTRESSSSEERMFKFEFLLVDPFSELARIRAAALDNNDMENVYWRLNTGIRNIQTALNSEGDKDEFEKKKQKIEYLEKQLEWINESQEFKNFEVRFTSEYTDLPCYIIGPYALKGVIFPETTARLNPWWVYVDDPTERNDSYSKHTEALNQLWNKAATAADTLGQVRREKEKRRTIFVSWGGKSDNVKRVVFDEIEKKAFDASVKFKPIDFETAHSNGLDNLIPDIYQRGIEESAGAIVLLLAEDEVSATDNNGKERKERRPRQNVIHELGYVQKSFQTSNVLIIKELGVDGPSNLDGEMVFVAERTSLDKGDASLKLRINSFLDRLK